MKKYSYEDIIENIYVENSAFPIMSRHITAEEVYDILPYNNVEKINNKIILVYKLDNGKEFSVYVTDEGIVTNMIYDLDNLVTSAIYYEIKEGMTYEEVLKLVPNAILVTNYSKILNDEQILSETPFCEVSFSDGTYAHIFFENDNGNYKVVEKGELVEMINKYY